MLNDIVHTEKNIVWKMIIITSLTIVLQLLNICFDENSNIISKILVSLLCSLFYFGMLWCDYKFFCVCYEKNQKYLTYYPLTEYISMLMFIVFLLATFTSLSSNNFQTPFLMFIIHILYYTLLRYAGLYKIQAELDNRNNFNKQSNYQHQNDMHWYLYI
jgi:hypothetical protein